MNNYHLIDYRQNGQSKKRLTKKVLNEIEKRQLFALRMNNYQNIEDAKQQIFKIIDDDGLSSDEQKTRLETALKLIGYITPQKKAIETTIITKSIEEIIKESTEPANFTVIDENDRDSKESANNE